jgi:hypothetical protein
VGIEAVLVSLEGGPVKIGDLANCVANFASRFIHRVSLGKSLAGFKAGANEVDHRLADGQAAAAQNNEDPLTGLDEGVHLACHVQVVRTGIGA